MWGHTECVLHCDPVAQLSPSLCHHCCCGGHPLHLLHPGVPPHRAQQWERGWGDSSKDSFTLHTQWEVLRGDGSLGVLEAEWASSRVLCALVGWYFLFVGFWATCQIMLFKCIYWHFKRSFSYFEQCASSLSLTHSHTSLGNVLAPGKIQTQIFECLPEKYLQKWLSTY